MTPEAVRARGSALTAAVIDAMYAADPFWLDRFGPGGRVRSHEDGVYHVRYLAEAMEADAPAHLARYACWLRGVIVARGMCTLHLETNLRLLADRFAEEAGGARPARFLRKAADALHADGWVPPDFAATLPAVLDAVRRAMRESVAARAPHDPGTEAAHVLSYVTDSLAAGRPELLAQHLAWLQVHCLRHGHGADYLPTLVGALGRALAVRDADAAVHDALARGWDDARDLDRALPALA